MNIPMIRRFIDRKPYCIGLAAVCFMFTFSSCHTEKKLSKTLSVTSPENKADLPQNNAISSDFILKKLQENHIPYRTFSAQVKIDLTTPNGNQNGIATFIRMQKDSVIWISVRPVLGIELVRILITPDSMKMINFFRKTLTLRSADSLQQLFHIPFDFKTLQNMIIGNAPLLTDTLDGIKIDSTQNLISFSCEKDGLISKYIVNANSYLLQKNILGQTDSSTGSRTSEETFSGYLPLKDYEFSHTRNLLIRATDETTAEIKFSRVEIDKDLSFPFPMVSDFKRD